MSIEYSMASGNSLIKNCQPPPPPPRRRHWSLHFVITGRNESVDPTDSIRTSLKRRLLYELHFLSRHSVGR